jgi:hypothetical protein
MSVQQDIVDRLGASEAAVLTGLLSELLADPLPTPARTPRADEMVTYK